MFSLIQPVYADVDIKTVFGPAINFPNVGSLVSVLLPNILLIAGIIAFIAVIFSGIKVISSAGDAKAEEANKGAFTAAVIGLIIIFGAYFFLQITGTIVGFNFLNPSP